MMWSLSVWSRTCTESRVESRENDGKNVFNDICCKKHICFFDNCIWVLDAYKEKGGKDKLSQNGWMQIKKHTGKEPKKY